MKFGEHLSKVLLPEWQAHYMDYAKLKTLLKASSFDVEEEIQFTDILEAEVSKVILFRTLKITELTDACERFERTHRSSQSVEAAERELRSLSENVLKLSAFVRLNYTATVKILKKHDKYTMFKTKPVFIKRLNARKFDQDHLEPTIIRLSAAYESIRQRKEGPGGAPETPSNEIGGDFIRKTTKYWVHPDNVTAIKCLILQHLPVLVHTDNPSPAITSIYLDDRDFSLYHERISKEEGAQAIRIRYYGQEDNVPVSVFVERKTHHEKWTGLKSVKTRFIVKEKHVQAILDGNFDVEKAYHKRMEAAMMNGDEASLKEIEKAKQLALEIQETVEKRSLRPMIRTSYNRMAFQIPGDARFRISLDTELRISSALPAVPQGPSGEDFEKNWKGHRKQQNERKSVPGDACEFPYAVLEVKTQTHEGVEIPEWVTRLIESDLVQPAPKFSKFGHGVATLRAEKISLLPAWLKQMEDDTQRPMSLYAQTALNKPTDLPVHEILAPVYEVAASRKVDSATASENDIESNRASIFTPSCKTGTDDHTIVDMDPPAKNITRQSMFGGRWSAGQLLSRSVKSNKTDSSPPAVKQGFVPKGIDPKLYMQNERTLLQWVKLGIICAAVGSGIVNFLGATDPAVRRMGVLVIFASILFIVLGYALYIWRGNKTKKRDRGHYDSIPAVTFVCMILVAALVLNLYFLVSSGSGVSQSAAAAAGPGTIF